MATLQPYRPNIGTPYKRLIWRMTANFNETAKPMSNHRDIHIVRMALEELFRRMFPGEELPEDVMKIHKRFYADLDFDPEVYTLLKQ